MQLGAEAGRVIGSLIEKQLTTPQQYPLTLNSLVLACNQSSNRDPVVSYDEKIVQETLAALKAEGLVRFVHPSHGRSVIRYRQVLDERLALDETELALLAVLLLRGPQTVGELRIRTERMASFDGISGVEAELGRLVSLPEPLVSRLLRRPGQKEERWVELLTVDGAAHDDASSGVSAGFPAPTPGPTPTPGLDRPAGSFGHPPELPPPPPVPRPGSPLVTAPPVSVSSAYPMASPSGGASELRADTGVGPQSRLSVEMLSEEVAELRAEVARLRAAFENLRDQLGG